MRGGLFTQMVVIGALGCAPGAQAQPQVSTSPTGHADRLGVHTLYDVDRANSFHVRVFNWCKSEQSFAVRMASKQVESGTVASGKTASVYLNLVRQGENQAGADFETFRIEARHTSSGGTCKARESAIRTVRVRWLPPTSDVSFLVVYVNGFTTLDLTLAEPPAEDRPSTPPVGLEFPAVTVQNSSSQPIDLNPFDADPPDNPFDPDTLDATEPTLPLEPPVSVPPANPPASIITAATNSTPREPVPSYVPLGDPLGVANMTPSTTMTVTPPPLEPATCTGGDCFELDTCGGGSCGLDPPLIPEPPGGPDFRYQIMGGELEPLSVNASSNFAYQPPPPPPPQMASRRMNPLGLLARSFGEFLEWWSPTVHAADALTIEQASRVPGGLQFLVTSLGGSTGKTLSMQVLNFTGKPINLQGMLALEPLKADAQQRVTQAFSKLAGKALPTRVDLRGYCFEFLKLPPIAGQLMTVAAPAAQKRFEPLKRVMTVANRLKRAGQLRPDSAPDAYGDSIKQWAIWTMEQKFNQNKFAEAFLGHTKKNVEASGQKWTKQIEDVVRQRTPNRWQDIVAILKGAGAAVPQ